MARRDEHRPGDDPEADLAVEDTSVGDEIGRPGQPVRAGGATMVGDVPGGLEGVPELSFQTVFARLFGTLRALHRTFRHDGVLLAAVVDGRTVAAHAHLPIDATPVAAILGRHARCDLQLVADPAISLRHAVVRAARSRGDLRLRVVDLSSRCGLRTEDGLPCEALSCEGPLFLRAGRYHLFFLPTGTLAPFAWSESADETWAAFPERIYLDRRIPDRLPRPPSLRVQRLPSGPPIAAGTAAASIAGRSAVSHVTLLPAARPLRVRAGALAGDGLTIATLTLSQGAARATFPVRDDELERGILVGRYERCQLGGADQCLSRVHVLIVREDDGVWAIDTASTNGVSLEGRDVRQARLSEARPLLLAGRIELRWEPAGPAG